MAELAVVRSLLDGEGIGSVVIGEEAVRLGPMRLLSSLFATRQPSAKLQVDARRAAEVEELLGELSLIDGASDPFEGG
ncbi:MAG TPA: hypothetical protein VMT85_08320 [Thermoanaerobaculia bacterium]|nr:hypothetical protein [Thermoanaerobaculia bacterium]